MKWLWIAFGTALGLLLGYDLKSILIANELDSLINLLPSRMGAKSWLQVLYWTGGAVIALAALATLEHRNRQAKAEVLLRLYERWEDMDDARNTFQQHYSIGRNRVKKKDGDLSDKARLPELRKHFLASLKEVHDNKSEAFPDFVRVLTFYETLGHFVRRRYVPFSEVQELFKGPILQSDLVFRDYITKVWQHRSETPPGLLKNALYLFGRIRRRENLINTLKFWRNWS